MQGTGFWGTDGVPIASQPVSLSDSPTTDLTILWLLLFNRERLLSGGRRLTLSRCRLHAHSLFIPLILISLMQLARIPDDDSETFSVNSVNQVLFVMDAV